MDLPGELEDVEILRQRLDFLTYLADEAAEKSTIVEELDHSRSTVDRAISALEDAGFVAETTQGYVTTLTGRLAVESYEQFLAETETIFEAESFLDAVPPTLDMPPSVVLDGNLETEIDDEEIVETVADVLSTAEECRAALHGSVDADVLDAIRSQARDGPLTATVLGDRSLFDRLDQGARESPSEAVELLRAPVPAVGILLVSDERGDERTGAERRLLLVVSDGGSGSVVETTATEAVEWAEASLEELTEAALDGDRVPDSEPTE